MKQRPSNLLLNMLRAFPTHGINDPGHSHNAPGNSSTLVNDSQLLETSLIEGLAANLIESPQKLANSLYYRMRITGTGTVWRESTGDTYRPPGKYINAEFIQRCVGLPIIIEHPESGVVDTEDKIVGTTVFAYVPDDKPEEVWCIARIIDGQAQDDLLSEKLSTSPSVITAPSQADQEGDPVYIDHLAIVPLGVWDHDGPPSGIDQDVILNDAVADEPAVSALEQSDSNEVIDMNPEELKKLLNDALEEHVKPIHERLDKLEGKGEEVKADEQEGITSEHEAEAETKREEKGEPEIKVDSHAEHHMDSDEDEEVKQNTELAALRAELEELKKAPAKPLADSEVEELADAQCMADAVLKKFGKTAQMPMPGERATSYRKRLIGQLKAYSPSWKEVDLATINDAHILKTIEAQVYADAAKHARKPTDLPKGKLREVKTDLGMGRNAIEFIGDCDAWMNEFKLNPAVAKFRPR